MVIESVFVNIISAILYDAGKKALFVKSKSEIFSLREKVFSYVKDNLAANSELNVDIKEFEAFFMQPQVCDVIQNYIAYIISGTYAKSLRRVGRGAITEHRVTEYLLECFIEYCPKEVSPGDLRNISQFFAQIFSLAKMFFTSLMDESAASAVFMINQKIVVSSAFLSDKMDKLETLVIEALNYPLVQQNENYDFARKEYMEILKKRYNKALIYLLDDFDLERFYIAPMLSMNFQGRHVELMHSSTRLLQNGAAPFRRWENIFLRENIVYVTGGAGYGKSLLMKNIILNSNKLNIADAESHIVIYGEIKWFINMDGSFKTMVEFLKACMVNSTLQKVEFDFIDYHLKMGRCILLLDALDEVPMAKRKDIHQAIIAYLKNLNPNNKVCLTSRDRGFIPVEDEIEHFCIEPLTPIQIEQYVDKIIKLGKFSRQDKAAFMKQAEGLVEKKFLNSFLILSLLINIYKGERELPETKLELYQKCLEYIANKREKPKTTENFDWKLIAPLMRDNTFIELSLLCFPNNKEAKEFEIISKLKDVYRDMFIDQATLENAVSEFIKFCSERTELFVPANVESCFKFFHRSFFEYFYSKYIVLRCINSEDIFQKLSEFDVDSEVFELTLARLKQETQDKYIELIKFVFQQCEEDFLAEIQTFKAFNMLILLFQVIDEEVFQRRFVQMVITYAGIIAKHIEKISNQEIVCRIIAETAMEEEVILAYQIKAYQDVLNMFTNINAQSLDIFLDDVIHRQQEQERVHFRISPNPVARRHFYTAVLLSQYDIATTLSNLFKTPLRIKRKKINSIRKLLNYYNALGNEQKEALNYVLGFKCINSDTFK